ncbi:Hypothetical predicted protein, partial [Olea europaea subsp. europaea]
MPKFSMCSFVVIIRNIDNHSISNIPFGS